MFASKELFARRESKGRGEKSEEEKGGRARCVASSRPGLEGELKIVSDYKRRGIDCHSVYRVAENEEEKERSANEEREGEDESKGPRLSKVEWNHLTPVQDTSPFRPIS